MGNNSWEAKRRPEAAIIDGLNTKSFISAKQPRKVINIFMVEKCVIKMWNYDSLKVHKSSRPFWALKMIWVALALRACLNGGSSSLNKEMKKRMKEKGVMDRILQFRAPKIRNSILSIVRVSKMIPPSLCIYQNSHQILYISMNETFLINLKKALVSVPENQG